MYNRRISLENIRNIRELGGLKTVDGRTIRKGMLIRSPLLSEPSFADLQVLVNDYHLSEIIDLRTSHELKHVSDVFIENVRYINLPALSAPKKGVTHEKESEKYDNRPQMCQIYAYMAEHCRENLRDIMTEIMMHDYEKGSVLWHCSEGKDRTGIVAAMLELYLGVDEETVMEDYLMTNEVNEPKAREVYRQILEAGGPLEEAEGARDAYLAKPEYLNAALECMTGKYGSMEAYLKDIGVKPDDMERFKAAVLE